MHGRAPAARARWLAGIVALGVYLVAAMATLAGPRHRMLPLFEGSGPPPPYQWVKPPPAFAAGNIAPQPGSADLVARGGTISAGVAQSPDTQVIINFGAGSFAPPPGDDKVHVVTTPLDPATLGPLPAGSKPDGNAYHIDLTYLPSARPVSALAAGSNIIISAPFPAAGLFYSADGRAWTSIPIQPVSGPSLIGASLTRPGWYLVSTVHSAPSTAPTGGHGTVLIAGAVAGGAALLGAAGLALARRRLRPAAARATGNGGRPGRGRTS